MNRKVKSFKQMVFLSDSVRYQKLQVFEVQSFGLDTCPQSFCHSFVALSRISCQPKNSLFSCVKSLLLLWKPHHWF